MKEAESTILNAALEASGIIPKGDSATDEQATDGNTVSQEQTTPTDAPPAPVVPDKQADDLEKKYKALQADYTRQAQRAAEAERRLAQANPPALDAAKRVSTEPEGVTAMRSYLENHPELYSGTDPVKQTQYTEQIAANVARAMILESEARRRHVDAARDILGEDADFDNPQFDEVYRVVSNGYKASGIDKNPALGAWAVLNPDKIADIKRGAIATATERAAAKAGQRVEKPTASRPAEVPKAKVITNADDLCLSISKQLLGEE